MRVLLQRLNLSIKGIGYQSANTVPARQSSVTDKTNILSVRFILPAGKIHKLMINSKKNRLARKSKVACQVEGKQVYHAVQRITVNQLASAIVLALRYPTDLMHMGKAGIMKTAMQAPMVAGLNSFQLKSPYKK